jgi:non-ribosomal peptide synthetase component F
VVLPCRSLGLVCASAQVLLHKYCVQDDIVVGTPYANREMSEVDEVLGAFVNTLALRTDLSGDPSFSNALDRAKAAATQAFAHGMAPFAKVVDSLGAVRSAAFTPVYQVRCSAHRYAAAGPQM